MKNAARLKKMVTEHLEEKGYTIREAAQNDIAEVMHINRVCLPENYPAYFFLQLQSNYSKAFLVAEKEGKVVGYIMCRVEYGKSHFGFKIIKKGHVVSIAVLPEYRRQGIGKNLLLNAEKALKEYGAKEIILEVRVSNTPAINLYEKLGYEKVKVLKGYYSDGEDAYLMAKKLE